MSALEQLMSGYFNQDWPLDAATPREVVEQYVAAEPPEVVAESAAELERLLAEGRSDEELRRHLLDDLGAYYDPASAGQPAGEWLRQVAGWLRAAS